MERHSKCTAGAGTKYVLGYVNHNKETLKTGLLGVWSFT